ncbi:NLR family CARD domain-containing protein 3-like [Betta splendens]|uniref:NLR family CARD domain-containing protein 3-like n=1 Tax=Betta splendens TaxID=158456 RepID=A0A6P7KX92_BETSP|nr:NLR family CARD domain-containing protein 3-like [Betta splendens]
MTSVCADVFSLRQLQIITNMKGFKKRNRQKPDSPELDPEPSDRSVVKPPASKRMKVKKSASPKPSCVSMRSDRSMEHPIMFKQELFDHSQQSSDGPSGRTSQQHSNHLDDIFKLLKENVVTFVKNELEKIQKKLVSVCTECLESQRKDEEELDGEDEDRRKSSRDAVLKITLNILRRMKQEDLADCLQNRCQNKLKSDLKQRVQCVFEGVPKAGNPTPLNQIYTELHITEGGTGGVNDEHEVRHIEKASWKRDGPETTISCRDIFKGPLGRRTGVRTVLTTGVAGIGKTVLTQKFTLDWAEGKANQDIHFTFPFTFRELNVLKERKFSLVELVHHFFPETTGIRWFEEFQVVFIFDGLDENRLPLDFHNYKVLSDVTASASVDVLLTNLIRGNLLSSARLWITTRPAAANQIPPWCVDMMTGVRGFTDPQKDEYFRKRFRDEQQATTIISHIKTSRSLHIMCHIPVFCWITATVLEDVSKSRQGGMLPNTLTEMYIHFLVVQTKLRNFKYDGGAETDPHWNPETKKMIESLGKLAFEQLKKGNLIFYESDLMECGIDVGAASGYSGVLTQIFIEVKGLHQDKVFCFVHLSVQEFLAALHVHLIFVGSGVNLLSEEEPSFTASEPPAVTLYHRAVDEALQSPNGHLDLFLRFLLGLSLETNQTLLRGLITQTGSRPENRQDTVAHIKKRLEENPSTERSINLFHCLNELNDHGLMEEIQWHMSSGNLSPQSLSSSNWSALIFVLLASKTDLDAFELKKYSASEEALEKLLPVVTASNKALLSGCNLSGRSCQVLSSALGAQSSNVRELDLSINSPEDSGVKLLSQGLRSEKCKLQTLRLSVCELSERSCAHLASVFSFSPSLRELDLSNNDLRDSGVELLSAGLKLPACELETLRLSGCLVTVRGCASLASVLSSQPCSLKELDLSYNHPGDSGVKLLSAAVQWRPEALRVNPAGVQWLRPGLRKYFCQLTLNPFTAHRELRLSADLRSVRRVSAQQLHSHDQDAFNYWPQLLCSESLTGRCYWEVEWTGQVSISVSYGGMKRSGTSDDCKFGMNEQSWSLSCNGDGYSTRHNNKKTLISACSLTSNRVAVYVDCAAGSLSFYRVSSDKLTHLHTFSTSLSEPLYPGFGFWSPGSSVSLCDRNVLTQAQPDDFK